MKEEKRILVKPDLSYAEEIMAYRQEFLDTGGSMDGCGALRRMADPRDWLQTVEDLSHKETVPEKWVLSTQFIYVRETDRKILGMIQVRHRFNEFLEKYAGHIGYSVRPSEGRKGYGGQMLRECLPYCRGIGLNKVLVTCLKENEASRRIIQTNGGIYESTVFEPDAQVYLERYWI